jgi:putative hydrolase of the HAD superfamily
MKIDTITDVFFDLDHTLWDFDKNSLLAFERVFQRHEIDIDLRSFVKIYEPINFEYWKLYREEKVSKEQLRRGRLIDTFHGLGMNYSLTKIDAMAVSYIDELPIDNHLFDGTVEILEYLVEKYNLHIITNGFQEVQLLKLKNSGIYRYFETVTTSEEVGVKKPNPLVFKTALRKAKTQSIQSIMIGDTFEADILGAEAVGMWTLFYNYRKETIPNGYKLVDHLLEIKSHL